MQKGYAHIYTGNGKGKTTAMLGLALRASGAGLRIYIGQFNKKGKFGEISAIAKYLPEIKLEQYGTGSLSPVATQADREAAVDGLKKATQAIFSGEYDIVMMDEVNIAVHMGLIPACSVVDLINRKPPEVELVLTGRYAAKELIDAADLVSEITEVKHYFNNGVGARKGIES